MYQAPSLRTYCAIEFTVDFAAAILFCLLLQIQFLAPSFEFIKRAPLSDFLADLIDNDLVTCGAPRRILLLVDHVSQDAQLLQVLRIIHS
jgi:hypothetical protein